MANETRRSQPWLLVGALIAVVAVVAVFEWVLVNVVNTDPQWDLAVYRGAIDTWTSGGSLYDFLLNHPARPSGFPFTYPPFAAIVLLPTTWLPVDVIDGIWTVTSLIITAAMAAFVVWRAPRNEATWLGRSPSRVLLVGLSTAALLAMLLTIPTSHQLALGQVSFFITALMLFDVGGLVRDRYRGALSGLAAAIKLTPLITVPYYLVTRQFRAALVAVGAFAAATAVAALVLPHDSVVFWTDRILQTDNVGEPGTIQNKSVLGLLARWDVGGTALWVAIALIVLGMSLWRAKQQYDRGQLVGAALIVGCASVAISPISWPHHQLWIALVAVWLLLMRRPVLMVAGALILLINLVGSPLMGQEAVRQVQTAPMILQLGRELPTLSFLAVCLLGLPLACLSPARADVER